MGTNGSSRRVGGGSGTASNDGVCGVTKVPVSLFFSPVLKRGFILFRILSHSSFSRKRSMFCLVKKFWLKFFISSSEYFFFPPQSHLVFQMSGGRMVDGLVEGVVEGVVEMSGQLVDCSTVDPLAWKILNILKLIINTFSQHMVHVLPSLSLG